MSDAQNISSCDPSRVEAFLDNTLDAAGESSLMLHLDRCDCCRELIHQAAADAATWNELESALKDARYDSVRLGSASEVAADVAAPHASSLVNHVLEMLAPTDDPAMLGRLGPYEISGVIGSGGMGVVLKGHDRPLDRTIAIKVLAPHLASSGSAKKRFSREARAAAAVLHPNVIAIHSVSNDAALPYLVMPYVRGASLQKRIDSEGPLPLVGILRIGAQIAAGLAAAHAQGLVHRDIKPANIMLEDGVERVAITDFGLARAVDDATMTRSGVIAGTPQYMSPEQSRGEPVDPRSDLFSLGSVLYAMCTGRPPFRAESTYGVIRRITEDEPTPIRELNPDIPAWFGSIIVNLMSKQPDDRFASASDVAAVLEECLAHVQQPATVPLPASCLSPCESSVNLSGRTRFRRSSLFRVLVAAGVAGLLIFSGVVIVLERSKGKLTITSEADDIPIRIVQGDKVVERLTITRTGKSIRIAAGQYIVEIDGPIDGLIVEDGVVELRRGGAAVARIVSEDHHQPAFKHIGNGVGVPLATPTEPSKDAAGINEGTRHPKTRWKDRQVSVTHAQVWTIDDDGKNAHPLVYAPNFEIINSPEVSPDGKSVAVDGWKNGERPTAARLLVIEIESGKVNDLGVGAMPHWSPDGKWIAFCKYADERGVFVRSIDGGVERRIDRDGWGMQWSPDGLKVAYTRGNKFVVHDFIAAGSREVLPDNWDYTRIYWNPAWSPDSKEICFKARDSQGRNEFAIINVVDEVPTIRRRIAADDFLEDIAWHPDGRRILIPKKAAGGVALTTANSTPPRTTNRFGLQVNPKIATTWECAGRETGRRCISSVANDACVSMRKLHITNEEPRMKIDSLAILSGTLLLFAPPFCVSIHAVEESKRPLAYLESVQRDDLDSVTS